MTTKQNLKDQLNIANGEWPAISEIATGRFKIHKKTTNVNIDDLTKSIKEVSDMEDVIINESVEQEETLNTEGLTVIEKEILLPIKPKKTVRNKKSIVEKIQSEQVKPKEISTKTLVAETKEIFKAETTEKVLTETPNNTSVTTKAIETPARQEVEMKSMSHVEEKRIEAKKLHLSTFLKFTFVGFAHLYVKNTTKALKPLNFLAENFSNIVVALTHLGIPLLMTWYLTTNIEFISNQIMKDGKIMSVIYSVVFYVACLFLWVSTQVIVGGLLNMFKKTLSEVANIGKSNNK